MSLVDFYENTIKGTMRASSLGDHTLHIVCGMIVLLLAARLLRRRRSSAWPLVAVIAAETFNETMDALNFGAIRADTMNDVLDTLALPLVIYALSGIFALSMRRCAPLPGGTPTRASKWPVGTVLGGVVALLLASVGLGPADAQRRSVSKTSERNVDYGRSGLRSGHARGEAFNRSRVKRISTLTVRLNRPTTSSAAKQVDSLELPDENN